MTTCRSQCSICCDFCQHYDFCETAERSVYTGKGRCRLHQRPQDPGDYCEDFVCFNLSRSGSDAFAG